MRYSVQYRLRLAIATLILVAALPCWAGELAILRNGFSVRHERRQVMGAVTRLYVSADGSSYVDVPTAEIEHFENAPPDAAAGLASTPPTKNANNPAAAGAGTPQNPVDLNQVVNVASGRYRLDPDLVNSVIRAESGFNVRAISPKGAQGLMQLMPRTASELGVPNAFDPRANVEGGTRYLRELLERYNFDLIKALAAYNAGPHRVEQYGGVPPYYETRAYVARIVRDFNRKKIVAKASGPSQSTAAKGTKAKTRVAGSKPQHSTTQASAARPSE